MQKSYTVAEACSYLSCGKTYFYALLNENKIRARKMGKKTIVLQKDLDSFLETLEGYKGGDHNG